MLRVLLLAALASLSLSAFAAETKAEKDARMKWWREARFGLFIHWGSYSVLEGEYNGHNNYAEWIREEAHIPVGEYEKVKDRFNPVKFDAMKWVKMAKDAGMKYVVITSKHHEGFDMFDSKYSDYTIMHTPFHRDVMKEMADACHAQGMQICFYHSIMDWHHPDYLPRRSWEVADRPVDGADMDRYVQYLHNQVTELLTKYGKIGLMWFDGEWESTWNHERGQALYDLCRKLQPNVIVNNRVDVGRGGMGGMSDQGFAGDYGTPEQEIPATGLPGVDWETCMTMNDHWGYNKADKDYKSSKQIIQMLCDIASKGGNYLLNIGPTPEGEFPPESVQRLKDIGSWMKVNSPSIYDTTASVFKKLPWGRCTVKREGKDTALFLQVFDWPSNGQLVVPGLGNEVLGAKLLAGRHNVRTHRAGSDVIVSVPAHAPDAFASVVELKVKGVPIVYDAPEIETDSSTFVHSLPVMIHTSPGLEIRYTLDGSTPKAASAMTKGVVRITKPCTLKVVAFHNGKAVSGVVTHEFKKATLLPAVQPGPTVVGLDVKEWEGDFNDVPETKGLGTPARSLVLSGFTVSDIPKKENVVRAYTGYLDVSADDVYKFALRSDDGSRLWIDDQLVVDNAGLHSPVEKSGSVALAKGKHLIQVEWHNKTGGMDLLLRMGNIGQPLHDMPAAALSRSTQ